MIKRTDKIGTFRATSENGEVTVIDVFQEIIDVGTLSDPDGEIPGLKSLKTRDGDHVNRVTKGDYKVLRRDGLDERLTSDDPAAV